jgi:hypothetical protein
MQVQSTSSSAVTQSQGQRHLTAPQTTGAKEKFDTRLRGSMGTPSSGKSGVSAPRGRSIPAAFQNQRGPTVLPSGSAPVSVSGGAMPGDGSVAAASDSATGTASASSNSDAFSKLSQDQANDIWYGGPGGGASVSGTYSEKASYGGQAGIGSPQFATTATGQDMVLSVTGLHGKNPAPTRVMALDSDAILKLTGGQWPGTPEEMQQVLKSHPEVILSDMQTNPPQMARISGIPQGTKVTVLTGAEAIMDTPPRRPPGSQAMITNIGQLSAKSQALVPAGSIMAGGTEQMMKAAAEMAARSAAEAMANRAAQETAQRMAMQGSMEMAAEGSAARSSSAAQTNAATSAMFSRKTRGGQPPIPVSGPNRGDPTSASVSVSVSANS